MGNINVAGIIKEASAALDEKTALTEGPSVNDLVREGDFDQAQQVQASRDTIRDRIAAYRRILRDSVTVGEATDAQAEWILATFPERTRNRSNDIEDIEDEQEDE